MEQLLKDLLKQNSNTDESLSILAQITSCFPIGIVIICNDHFHANQKFYELIGCDIPFHTLEDYLSSCTEDYILYQNFSLLLNEASSFTRLYSMNSLTGQNYYVENYTSRITDKNQNIYYITTLTDRTEQNHLSQRFEEHQERFHVLEEVIPTYTFEYDLSRDILHFSERWKPDGINTVYPHALKWLELHEIIHPEDSSALIDAMTSGRICKEVLTLDFRAKFLKDEYTWYRIYYKTIRSRHTNLLQAIGTIANIDHERLFSPDDVPEGVDPVTGLLLPIYMQNIVDQILKEEPTDHLCSLMLLQLDNFEELKKTTGDLYSSQIERQVAQKLKSSFRSTDVLAYSQDGRYIIFLRKVPENIVTARANNVLNIIQEVSVYHSEVQPLTCSIGIALAPLDGTSYLELFLKADSAMYLSKARGGNIFSYFNPEIDARQK